VKRFFKKEINWLLKGGCLDGFSFDGLVLFLNAFSINTAKQFLIITKDNSLSKKLHKHLRFLKSGVLYYPEQPIKKTIPGFQAEHNLTRSQALIGLYRGSSVCVSTKKAATAKTINNKTGIKNLVVSVGQVIDRNHFCEKISSFGFLIVDFVYSPGEISIRGDIVDVFPENKKHPVRLSFDFNKLAAIYLFDIETQRKTKQISSFVFFDLIGEPTNLGRSLFDFVRWFSIIKLKEKNGVFGLFLSGLKKKKTLDFKTIYKKPITKKLFYGIINSYVDTNVFVYYTNKKRKKKIKKLGAVPVLGHLNTAFQTTSFPGLFLPDFKKRHKQKNNTTHKPLFFSDLGGVLRGDFIVHVLHGVGRFDGLVVRGPSGFEKEYIKLLYREGGVLFVPLDKSSLVHKYQGVGGSQKINKLGGNSWRQNVAKTKKSVELVSKTLVELYSLKSEPRSFKYEKPGEIDLAIKKSFPYKETRDQKKAIFDVFNDLKNNKPMDRLICGDVGFGKTEIALRAIVRASISSKQVVFLCPTTVLSDQHYITTKERLFPLGIRIALLSRFQTKTKQKKLLADVVSGSIDLVIGTHRLLSDDVIVPNIGLLIIDEEHRFGVKHKEKIRALKKGLDVLSLSATPIPRTLQQSLLGIRDISRIETPPTTRKPINTFVEYFSWVRVVEVIEEELLRGGQIYFLHNNVQSIDYQTNKLREKFPNEKIKYIHGKQDSRTLEKNLLSFFDGGVSILVCSTIIESGLDVSNANCIIINNPQNLGLSQLYQIRGRVGRGSRQASCYLLLPKNIKLGEKAFRRLKTIEKHTSLGSGYSIASQDLDIRGAGAVFGYKQSGQISRVGLEYYNKLLKESVDKKLKKPEPARTVDVFFFGKTLIPKFYVFNEVNRLSFYTKINKAEKKEDIKKIEEELFDRFGKIPLETKNFLNLAKIKLLYKKTKATKIIIQEKNLVFELDEKKINKKTIQSVLDYKNETVLNKKFKESVSHLSVFFDVPVGFDWYRLILNCYNLFYIQ
tara:strand:- start:662 stop:3688 length:3027 start_codon:yes stop_codon:yes gene_type:complete